MAGKKTVLGTFAKFAKQQGAFWALLIIVIVASFSFPEFSTYTNISNVLRQSSMIGLISIGMTFVILTGGIDLSVGSVAALCSVIAAKLSVTGNVVLMIAAPILIAGVLGFINGFVVSKMRIEPFIATLGMMMAARGVALVLTNGVSVGVEDAVEHAFAYLARSYVAGIPFPVIIFIIVLVGMAQMAKYTMFGRSIYAIGGNEDAAVMMGLKVNKTKCMVYTLSGLLTGLAGVILSSRLQAGQPVSCQGWEMTAIASVAVGGTQLSGGKGKVTGTFLGVLIIGIISNIINLKGNVNSWWQSIVTGLLLLLVVIMQSLFQKSLVKKEIKTHNTTEVIS